jgi:hypothetical protein
MHSVFKMTLMHVRAWNSLIRPAANAALYTDVPSSIAGVTKRLLSIVTKCAYRAAVASHLLRALCWQLLSERQ